MTFEGRCTASFPTSVPREAGDSGDYFYAKSLFIEVNSDGDLLIAACPKTDGSCRNLFLGRAEELCLREKSREIFLAVFREAAATAGWFLGPVGRVGLATGTELIDPSSTRVTVPADTRAGQIADVIIPGSAMLRQIRDANCPFTRSLFERISEPDFCRKDTTATAQNRYCKEESTRCDADKLIKLFAALSTVEQRLEFQDGRGPFVSGQQTSHGLLVTVESSGRWYQQFLTREELAQAKARANSVSSVPSHASEARENLKSHRSRRGRAAK